MAKLSDEEKSLLEKLTAKANEPDDGDDYDVEWWEEDKEGNRKGGRLPWSKGKSIYGKHFPDLFGDKPPEDKGNGKGGGEGEGEGGKGKGKSGGPYFGR